MKYVYFISFNFWKKFNYGVANVEVILDKKITKIDQITEIENFICEQQNLKKVIIRNYQLLRIAKK